MSIYIDSKKNLKWNSNREEISCRIPSATLSHVLKNQIEFDPKSFICAFKNGRQLDVEEMHNLTNCKDSSSIFSRIASWFSARKDPSSASVLIVKRGRFSVDNIPMINCESSDFMHLNCQIALSVEISNINNFVLNTLEDVNKAEFALPVSLANKKIEDENELERLFKEKKVLQDEINELTKLIPLFKTSPEIRAAKEKKMFLLEDLKVLESEIKEINDSANETYLKDYYNTDASEYEYYIYNTSDFYQNKLRPIVYRVLSSITSSKTEEELRSIDAEEEFSLRLKSDPQVVSRLNDLGVSVYVGEMRLLSFTQSKMVESMRAYREKNFERQLVLDVKNPLEDELVRKEDAHAKLVREREQANTIYEKSTSIDYNKKINELDNQAKQSTADSLFEGKEIGANASLREKKFDKEVKVETAKITEDGDIDIKSVESSASVEKEKIAIQENLRKQYIRNLAERSGFESNTEKEWFIKELLSQDLIKTEDFDKLKETIESQKEDRKWDRDALKEDRDLERDNSKEDNKTLRENKKEENIIRHNSFKDVLTKILELDLEKSTAELDSFKNEQKWANELKQQDIDISKKSKNKDSEHDLKAKDKDSELDIKSKDDNYDFDKTEKGDNYAFGKKAKEDDYDLNQSYKKFDYERARSPFDEEKRTNDLAHENAKKDSEYTQDKRVKDDIEDRDFRNKAWQERTKNADIDRHEKLEQSSHDRELEKSKQEKEHQLNSLDRINEQSLKMAEANRLSKKDNIDATVRMAESKEETERLKQEKEIEMLKSELYRDKFESEARLKAANHLYSQREEQVERERNERERLDALYYEREEKLYRRSMAEKQMDIDEKDKDRIDAQRDKDRESKASLESKRMDSEVAMSKSQYDAKVEALKQESTYAEKLRQEDREDKKSDMQHIENLESIKSDERVAEAISKEKDNTISHIEKDKAPPVKDMCCDKCNTYFQSEFAICPLCGSKLRKISK